MSGPIVRKYGFPNFDKIFGERGLQHGVDEAGTPEAETPDAAPEGEAKAESKPTKGKKGSK
jgi:hypothetical protein